MPQNVNFAIKATTLQDYVTNHVPELPAIPATPDKNGLDAARDSIALVRTGIVEEKDVHAPTLVCAYSAGNTIYGGRDVGRSVSMIFLDSQTSRRLAVIHADNPQLRPTDADEEILDEIFAKVYPKFFPDKPNPFVK